MLWVNYYVILIQNIIRHTYTKLQMVFQTITTDKYRVEIINNTTNNKSYKGWYLDKNYSLRYKYGQGKNEW